MQETLERIYLDHRQGLYTLALAITRNPAAAEDAVQDAFARLWAADVRPEGTLVPYVFAAVRNAALDQVRRRARAAQYLASASIYNGLPEDPAAGIINAEQHRLVRDAVDALPDAEREAVVLRVYGGLTFDEMARTLGEPLPTVASRYRRALGKLGHAIQGIAESYHD